LVNHGLIIKERSKEDQRRVGVCLTKEAEAILSKAPGPAKGILPEALQALSESALQALDNSLIEVIEQLSIRDNNYADKPLSDL
ncbi:MAG: MarR family transcriptional regulator, partial [Gallionellaceae bacterium]